MGLAARIVARNRDLPPGRDSLLSSRRMATTHDNVVPLRRRCRLAPGTLLSTIEAEAEARAVNESVRRYEAKKAARRAAWGMPPLLAYAIIAVNVVLWATIGWIVNGIIDGYDDRPDVRTEEPADPPATTVTGTTVELDQ